MKSPDEIKKGLRCLSHDRTHTLPCSGCEYHGQGLPPCRTAVHEDAIALIQRLEATVSEKEKVVAELSGKIGQLEGKLDEAINDLHRAVNCPATLVACEFCKNNEVCPHDGTCDAVENDRWQWRGIYKEEH